MHNLGILSECMLCLIYIKALIDKLERDGKYSLYLKIS